MTYGNFALSLIVFFSLGGCENIGPLGNPFSSPPRPEAHRKISSAELAQCPRPNGVFQNEDSLKVRIQGLERFFRVDGFPTRSRVSNVSQESQLPMSTSETALHLLGGSDEQGRHHYVPIPGENFTLEIRPMVQPSWFHLTVRSSLGRLGEGEARLDLSRSADGTTGNYCQDGKIRGVYGSAERATLTWWVEAATGDIVGSYPLNKGPGEITFRYKRIGV